MIAFLTSPWGWLTMALTALAIAGSGFYAGDRWEKGNTMQARLELANYKNAEAAAALKKFQDTAKRIETASQAYTANTSALRGSIDVIVKDLKNVQAKKPLPRGCKPDADRLRSLGDAVSATNAVLSPFQMTGSRASSSTPYTKCRLRMRSS